MKKRKYILRFLLLFSGFLVSLFIAELVIRIGKFAPAVFMIESSSLKMSNDKELLYEMIPYKSTSYGDTLNSFGFRSDSVSIKKGTSTIRLMIVGDSIAYGMDIKRNKVFPFLLQTMLNKYSKDKNTKYEVVNISVPGYNLNQEIRLIEKWKELKPDIVLIAYCLNDLQDYSYEYGELKSQLSNNELSLYEDWKKGKNKILLESNLYRFLKYRIFYIQKKELQKNIDKEWISIKNYTWADYYRNLYIDGGEVFLNDKIYEFKKLSEKYNFKPFILVFPVLLNLDNYPLLDVHEKIRKAGLRFGIYGLDLLNTYRSYTSLSKKAIHIRMDNGAIDPLHPNEIGHKLAAIAVLIQLCKSKLINESFDIDEIWKCEFNEYSSKKEMKDEE